MYIYFVPQIEFIAQFLLHSSSARNLKFSASLRSKNRNSMSPEIVVDLEVFRKAQKADGPASILAIGTATPPNTVDQSTYPDYFFRITGSEHKTKLKEKFTRICNKTAIRQRHLYLTEEIVTQNPNMWTGELPSMDARQDILKVEVPKLAKEAAVKAIDDWGQPKSKITHMVFYSTTLGVDMPGADYQLAKLLGLQTTVKRVLMAPQGCFAGGTVLRVAKDLAENNRGARILVICSEFVNTLAFRPPSETHFDGLIGEALFGDGASALIVGADPIPEVEKPCFQLIWAEQSFIPESDGAIHGHTRGVGQMYHLGRDLLSVISNNVEKSLVEAFQQFGISDWNKLFWIAHPGGAAILDQVEAKLHLDPKKLSATRRVLSEYGNMSSGTVHFILDEMRKASRERGCSTTGEGLDIGVLFGFGPGVTIETVVLKSIPL